MIDFTLGFALRRMLYRVAAAPSEYVIFGSTVMYLHGLRAPETVGDCDVFVSRRVWGALLADTGESGATVETPRADDPPFLEFRIDTPIHFFFDWTARDSEWMNVAECFALAEPVVAPASELWPAEQGWQCIPLSLLRRHKALAHSHNLGSEEHEKHQRDLRLLDAALA